MNFGYHPDYGIPDEQRAKVVLRAEAVVPVLAAAEYNVSLSSVYSWIKARKQQEVKK